MKTEASLVMISCLLMHLFFDEARKVAADYKMLGFFSLLSYFNILILIYNKNKNLYNL